MINLLNNKKFKIISIVLILAIFSIVLINTKPVKHFKNNIITYFEANNYEEKDFRDAVNSMYVTMTDQKSNVIATTNPDREINSSYTFSDTEKPSKMPNTTDEYNILFEIMDTSGNKGYTKLEENVIYSMELPEYIVPQNAYDEGINVYHECHNFAKKGKTIACGGIYQEQGKYFFKALFKDVLNKKDVKASYQFNIKLDKKIEDVVFNIKTIDFDLPGALQLFMEKTEVPNPPVPQGKDYDVKIESEGWISRTKNYAKWVVTVTDKHTDGYKMNGSLYIDFGPYMAFFADQSNFYNNVKMYIDGQELNKIRDSSYSIHFNREDQTQDAGYAMLSMLNREDPRLRYSYSSAYSFSASQLKIDMAEIDGYTLQNNDIEGIHEWKFEFRTKEYSTSPTSYTAQVRFIDNNDLEKEYKDNASISYNGAVLNYNFNYTPQNINNYGVAETLAFKGIITNDSNILKIKSVPEESNDLGLYYIMDNIGFTSMHNNLSGSIQIKINNKVVNFTKNGWSADSVGSGQVQKADPVLQKLLEKTDTYDVCFASNYSTNISCSYFRSDITNEDGDYYWIVLSKDTADRAENLYNGIYDYVDSRSDQMSRPAEWEFTLFNAKNSDIELTWNQNLQYYDRVSENIKNYYNYNSNRPINNLGGVLLSGFYVNNNYSQTGYGPTYLLTPLRIKGEVLNDNFVKWEMKLDTQYMHTLLETDSANSNLSTLRVLSLNFQIPTSHFISSGYYDVDTNSIVKDETSNSIDTSQVSYCIEGKNNSSNNSTYDFFECTKYEGGETLSSSQIEFMETENYPHLENIGHLNRINNSNSYNNYYAMFQKYYENTSQSVKSINALQGDQKGEIRLVFFTKSNMIGLSQQDIYVNAIGATKRKSFGRTSYNTNIPLPIFSITNKATIPKSNVYKVESTSSNNRNSIKKWQLHIDNSSNYSFSNIFEEKRLSQNKYPDTYNGRHQFTDKFSTNTNEERIIAENTKLKKLYISNDNNYTKYYDHNNNIVEANSYPTNIEIDNFDNLTQDENGFYKVCNTSAKQFCMKIRYNYGDDCPTFNKNDTNCTKYENMKYGFEVITEGFNKAFHFVYTYETETDIEKVADAISANRLNNSYIEIENNVKEYVMDDNQSGKPIVQTKTTYELLADLSISKKIDTSELNKNYKNDITKQTVVATIGLHSTKYLDITDFIDGISNLKYNSSTKTYEKEEVTVALNSLIDIRKYINISNRKIDIKPHYDLENEYKTIYYNNSFIDEYEGSTLEYINDSNELYKLHLVRSDGEDIVTKTDVRITYDLNFNPDQADNYRDDDKYKGGKYYISTNVEGVRTYETVSSAPATGLSFANRNVRVQKLSSQDGDYENKIDTTNKTLTAYASNEGAAIGADYLYPPELVKKEINKNIWEVDYYTNSAGKSTKAQLNLIDSITFTVDGNSTYNNKIIEIYEKYTKYKNLKIYYNGKNTTTSDEPYYTIPELAATNQITIDDKTGELKSTDLSLELQLNNFEYGDVIIITYEVDIDLVSAYREMYDKNYVDESNKLTDTKQAFTIKYTNGVSVPYYDESIKEQSSSKISVSDFTPSVTKRNTANNNDESSWEIRFNTGITDKSIKVKDNLIISSDNEELISIIEKSLIINDLVIKYDNNIIYENGEFIDNWEDNITINNNKLGLELLIKDTEDNTFLANNKQFIITYKTAIDNEKYNSKISKGIFDIENSVEVEKDTLKAKDATIKSGINYDFPMTLEKTFVGNDSTLTETNWKYTVESGRIDRENIIITDSIELGSDFSKYLSISKLKITKDEEVIFDNTKNINNLGDYELTDNENNTLIFNKNGHYQFNLNIPKLNKNSKIVVEYTLKVDDNEYIINNEILDNELLIKNKLNLKSDDGTNLEKNKNASSKVTSKLRKKFNLLSNNNGVPKVRWTIDVNLLSKYSQEELVDSEVIIEDVLSDILELDPNSVIIKSRTVTTNNETIGSVIPNDKYELNAENNTVKIRLFEPNNTPNLEITFDTDCLASITELENYVTLSIDGKKEEIRSNNQVSLMSPYSFGFIQSREDLIYNIEGKKLLDDKPSNKEFIFRIEEVDEEGNLKENGYYSEVTNSNDGKITFNALTFTEEGLYYYKVKEVPGNDKYIKYDDTEYTVRIKVIESHGTYIIDNLTIIDNDSNEIVFNNKTIPKEENNNVIVNPKTKTIFGIIISIIILLIIGTNISRKKTKVH